MNKQEKVGKVMHEFKEGELKSHGKRVTNRKQAIAIALNEAGISKKMREGGKILAKDTFVVPSGRPMVILKGEVITSDGQTKLTQPITIRGYAYRTLFGYRVLFYQDYKGILYNKKFNNYEQAQKIFNEKIKHYNVEIDKAREHKASEIMVDKFESGGKVSTGFKFNIGDTVKINQYDGGKLVKLSYKIIDRFSKKQSDGSTSYFYWVNTTEAREGTNLMYDQYELLKLGNKPKKAKACAGMAVPLVVLEAGGILGEYYDLRIPLGSGDKSEAISRVINSAFYNNEGKLDKERMDKTIKALAKKNDKIWIKEWNDYKETFEVEEENGKYINPFTVHHFMNRGGTTGGRGGSELPDNYYVYKWYEERGHLTMSVEDKDNNYLWEYDNESGGSNPVDDGFMDNLDDTDGLEKYLIDMKVLPANAVLIDENTALQKYEHYQRGGIIASVTNFFTGKTSLKEIFG